MIIHRPAALAVAAACALVAGCASYSGIAPEAKTLDPAKLEGAENVVRGDAYQGWPRQDWWRDFNDPVLAGLVDQALADSPSLQAAESRLRRAQAITGLAESTLGLQSSLSVDSTRERFSENGTTPPPYAGTTQTVNDLQLGASWELDFFGKNREGLKAAIGELRATEAEHQAARMMLAADVARSYYSLARLLAQREVALQRSRQREELAALTARRFQAGLETRTELETARGQVPENARDVAALDEQIAQARHALSALIGQGPAAVDGIAPALPAAAPLALPASLPANLLGHRADVVAARWRVESSLRGLDSAKALFYPNVNLRAFTGFNAVGSDNWLEAASRQPGIGLAVSLPLFDSGRLRSVYRGAAAFVDSSVAGYNSTLLGALREVADQLSSLQSLELQLSRQQATLVSAEHSLDLAQQRYRAGITDRLAVLNAETAVLVQRRALVDLQGRWVDGRVNLIRVLGGGFEETPALADASR